MCKSSLFFLFLLILVTSTSTRAQYHNSDQWIPLTSSQPSNPSLKLKSSTKNFVSFDVEIPGIWRREQEQNKYQKVILPSAESSNKDGYPDIPVFTTVIAIPDCDDILIDITPINQIAFNGYYIAPVPKIEHKKNLDGTESTLSTYTENLEVYNKQNKYPGKFGEIIETGYFRNQKIARIAMYPIQFIPLEKRINAISSFTVNVTFINPTSEINKELGIFRNILHNASLNYKLEGLSALSTAEDVERIINTKNIHKAGQNTISSGTVTKITDISALLSSNPVNVDYLIIVHSSLFNSTNLMNLANRRASYNGYDVVICQVDASGINNDIYDFYPDGDNYKHWSIARFILDVYNKRSARHTGDGYLGYIMLVGDVLQDNGSRMLPTPWFQYSSGILRGDFRYTKMTSDWIPDLMYGRLSVGNDVELGKVVNKILAYENNSNNNWANNTVFMSFSPDLFNNSDPSIKQMVEYIPADISKSYFFRAYDNSPNSQVNSTTELVDRRYTQTEYSTDGLNCSAQEANIWLYNKLNSGTHTFIYNGHAGWNALGAGEGSGRTIFYLNGGNLLDLNNTYSFNNSLLPNRLCSFMLLVGCSTGELDLPNRDCLAEEILNFDSTRGAVGVLAANQEGSSADFGIADRYIIEAMHSKMIHSMGEAIIYSKIRSSDYHLNHIYNVFGDPALNLFPSGYNISQDITLSGNVTISTNLTVNSTLTIMPGTNIRFTNGASLIVNGTLNSNGNSLENIIFDFLSPTSNPFNGIRFMSGSNGSLNFCQVRNANIGVYCSGVMPSISNCVIENNNTGIYGNNFGATTTQVTRNTIRNNTSCGIYLYNSSPYISNNTIINNGNYGINCYYYSSPKIYGNTISGHSAYGLKFSQYSSACLAEPSGPYYNHGHNIIQQNGVGIFADYYSNLFLGSGSYGGHNCIHGNTGYEMQAYYNCTIQAENNWWNYQPWPYYTSNDFYVYQSNIDYIPSLSGDPNGCALAKLANTQSIEVENDIFSLDEELLQALQFEIEGENERAAQIYKRVLLREKENVKGKYSLVKLEQYFWNNKKKNDLEALLKQVGSVLSPKSELYAMLLEIENHWNLSEGNYSKVIENLNVILNSFGQNDDIYKNTLFNLGFIYNSFFNNVSKAKDYFGLIQSKYPGDPLVNEIKYLLFQIEGFSNSPKQSSDQVIVEGSELDYKLLGNYPNPFNPTTTIRYFLPKSSKIEIEIFDIMGNEVRSFLIGEQPRGNQMIFWDGHNNHKESISSGIYLYRFKAQSLEDNQVFEKTAKLIMLK